MCVCGGGGGGGGGGGWWGGGGGGGGREVVARENNVRQGYSKWQRKEREELRKEQRFPPQ